MAKAIADPDELRRFAQDLKRLNGQLQSQLGSMHARLAELGQTWRDQEHKKFVEEFEHTMRALAHFTDATDRHIPFLLRKAQRLEEYLRQQ